MKKLILLFCGTILAARFPVVASTFNADFNTGTLPAGSGVVGNATVTTSGGVGNTGVLRIIEAVGGPGGVWLIYDFSGSASVNAFNATFKIELGNTSVVKPPC